MTMTTVNRTKRLICTRIALVFRRHIYKEFRLFILLTKGKRPTKITNSFILRASVCWACVWWTVRAPSTTASAIHICAASSPFPLRRRVCLRVSCLNFLHFAQFRWMSRLWKMMSSAFCMLPISFRSFAAMRGYCQNGRQTTWHE